MESDFDKRLVEKWTEAVKLGHRTEWVAKEMGITRRYTVNRAKLLKQKGVKLPSMVGGRLPSVSKVDELNKIIEESS